MWDTIAIILIRSAGMNSTFSCFFFFLHNAYIIALKRRLTFVIKSFILARYCYIAIASFLYSSLENFCDNSVLCEGAAKCANGDNINISFG